LNDAQDQPHEQPDEGYSHTQLGNADPVVGELGETAMGLGLGHGKFLTTKTCSECVEDEDRPAEKPTDECPSNGEGIWGGHPSIEFPGGSHQPVRLLPRRDKATGQKTFPQSKIAMPFISSPIFINALTD
jgi:hypothetical protein